MVSTTHDAFAGLKISSWESLKSAKRVKCPTCSKSRRYYCGPCCRLFIDGIAPGVKLPIKFDILQTASEVSQRSTAAHAVVTSPDHVKIWRPFPEVLDEYAAVLKNEGACSKSVLLYPTEDAITVEEAVKTMPDLERVVVIDSTWTKSVDVEKMDLLKNMKRVKLSGGESGKGRTSKFWRYAPLRKETSPMFNPETVHGLLATVEAIHIFCVEHFEAFGGAQGIQHKVKDSSNVVGQMSVHITLNVYLKREIYRSMTMRDKNAYLDRNSTTAFLGPLGTIPHISRLKHVFSPGVYMCSEPHAQANILSRRALLRSGLAVGLTTLLTTRNVDAAVDFDIDRFGDKELKVSAINRVKQNLRNVLAERPELLGTFVLLALHDGLTYDQSTGAGGPNGSLRFEGDWEQNKELGDAMEVIKDVRKLQRDQMSFADTCCFAGAVAVEITGGPRIRIQLGREDAAGQDPIGNSDGIAPGRSANEIVDAFNTSGLNGPRDAVLFHGAFGSLNDIGRTRLEKLKKQKELADEDDEEGDTISGDANNVTYGKTQGGKRGAVLVSSNVSNLTFGGAKFSNDYLKFMLEADKKKSADLSDRDRKMLAHPGIRDNVTLYAGKNKKFVTDFADVFEKVTMLGSRYESTKLEDQ